jgi:hypothetical protein
VKRADTLGAAGSGTSTYRPGYFQVLRRLPLVGPPYRPSSGVCFLETRRADRASSAHPRLTSQRLKEDEDRPKYKSNAAGYGTDGVCGSHRLRNQIEQKKAHDQEDDEPLDPRHVVWLILPVFTSDYSNARRMYTCRSLDACRCRGYDLGQIVRLDSSSAAIPGHPDALVLAALVADAAAHVRRVGAVLEVVPACCCQRGIQFLGPFLVGLGEPPHLLEVRPRSRTTVLNGVPA